jgi:hypothetical protein
MIAHSSFTYQSALQDALKIDWRVEDLIGGDKQLDFTRPFLPDTLVGLDDLEFLSPVEKLILNQIRGNSYLHLFVLVEEFIIPMVLEQVRRMGYEDIYATQALLCFAEEEGKHIHLFQTFAREFEQGFGSACPCIGPTQAIADTILEHHALSVLFLTLQFEWTTQSHYLESIRHSQDENLDPRFCSMLKHHWMEEAQHTKLDTLLALELAAHLDTSEIAFAIEDYLAIVDLFDQALMAQVRLDLKSFEQVCDRPFSAAEQEVLLVSQELSYRWTYICAGMTHPKFLEVVDQISPDGKAKVLAKAKALS